MQLFISNVEKSTIVILLTLLLLITTSCSKISVYNTIDSKQRKLVEYASKNNIKCGSFYQKGDSIISHKNF